MVVVEPCSEVRLGRRIPSTDIRAGSRFAVRCPGPHPAGAQSESAFFFNPSAGKLEMHTAPRVWSGLAIPRTRSEFVLQWLGGRCELHQPNS